MTVLVHIGFHKTGTTWLQRSFFDCDPFFGVIADQYEVDRWIIRPHGLDFHAERVRARIAGTLSAARESGAVPVISAETLSGNPLFGGRESYELAHRLKEVFGEARILITIREQVSILISTYKQYILRCGTEHHARFFHPDVEPGYFAFDWRHYEFDRLTRLYADLFGAQNVRVMLYEDLVQDSLQFCRQVAAFGCGHGNPAIRRPDPTARGVSPSDRVLPILRQINRFRAGRMNPAPCLDLGPLADAAYRATVRLGGRLPHRRGAEPQHSPLRAYVPRHFAERYRESNSRLSQMIGRDLAAAGYAMLPVARAAFAEPGARAQLAGSSG